MKLPNTTVMYVAAEKRVTVINPLVPDRPYVIRERDLEGKGKEIRELFERIVKTCQEKDDLNGSRDNRFYASMELSKRDWEWIFTFSVINKTKSP